MKSKICGISDSKTLKFLTNHPAPPHFIGFIANYPKSKRFIEIGKLKDLLKIDKKKSFYVAVLVRPEKKILEEIKDLPFDYYQIYDCEPDELKNIKENINVVIHLASVTNAEASFKFKDLIYKNNLGIFKKICNFCLKKKAKLIHLSSTSIYGSQSSLVDEDCDFLKPQSPYADVKLLEEKYLKKKENRKLKYITLRLGTITGVSKGMRFHTAVNKFCYKTILKEETN